MKVCLVGSSGGHLTHLYMLKDFWKDKDRFWVTFDKEDARSILENEKVIPCYYPTNRNIKNLIKNTFLAIKVLLKEKPDLIISSGAAVAVPFFYIGKILGAKLVYIEVFDRIDKPTVTGKLVYPIDEDNILAYTRMRYEDPRGDYGRQLRQRMVLEALVKKIATIGSMTKYQSILNAISSNMKTNLTFDDMKSIATKYSSASKIEQIQLQGESQMIDGVSYEVVPQSNLDKVTSQLKKALNE